jgi:SPP1 family predicted phage head-tail adaptor
VKCCDLTPAMLRTSFSLSRQTATNVGAGARSLTYANYASGKCYFKSESGIERLYAERIDSVSKHRATIRYRSDVKESDRMLVNGRIYNIRFINNIEQRNRWLELYLDGGVAA